MRPPVRQTEPLAVDPVDPEIAPVEQPVRQPLDLVERALERRVAGDRGLHQVDLVQVLRADRLLDDLAGEQPEHAEREANGDPPDRRQGLHRGHGDDGAR